MSNIQEQTFEDANKLDKRIPQSLLMKYQGQWYILKAGLEWKANYLFGGGNYGVTTEIVERTDTGVLAKATFRTRGGVEFSNYGEASKANVSNPQMHKYLLHLAVTRAECRVLRMATACGYTSVEEMDMSSTTDSNLLPASDDTEPVTDAQVKTIKSLKGKPTDGMTRGDARKLIEELSKGGGK